jgi:RNA polymerase sigma-70 factor (ECF subfamily)
MSTATINLTHKISGPDPEPEPGSEPEPADTALVERVRRGDAPSFALLMRRYNQRLYRVARAIMRDDCEAEDVLQHAYLVAYAHLHQFEGRAAFSTWVTRIVINHALLRQRQRRRARDLRADPQQPDWRSGTSGLHSPEDQLSRVELARLLESAIEALPELYRAIVVLREIDGLSLQDAAACLSISEPAARVRLHRARSLLREDLWQRAGEALPEVFAIGGARCAGIIASVGLALWADMGEELSV